MTDCVGSEEISNCTGRHFTGNPGANREQCDGGGGGGRWMIRYLKFGGWKRRGEERRRDCWENFHLGYWSVGSGGGSGRYRQSNIIKFPFHKWRQSAFTKGKINFFGWECSRNPWFRPIQHNLWSFGRSPLVYAKRGRWKEKCALCMWFRSRNLL